MIEPTRQLELSKNNGLTLEADASGNQSSSSIFIENATDEELVTGSGGPVEVLASERQLIAIMRNGLAVVAKGSRWTLEVKAILDRAVRSNIEIVRIEESDSETILGLYNAEAVEGLESDSRRSRVERQHDLRRLIAQAAEQHASDIHFQVRASYCEIRIRVHGRLRHLTNFSTKEGIALINAAFAVAVDQGAETGSTSFMKGALTRASGLLPPSIDHARLQYSPTSGHRASLVMRLKYNLGKNEFDISGLGYLPKQIAEIAIMRRRTSGLYLLAGKVSSGKTTTLQRILNSTIKEKQFEISVFSIEEPVELDIAGAVHVAVISKTGQSRGSAFVNAIKSTLRSDPNVVVLGELRDKELAGYAIELAMTGHALWTTVHSGSALGILDRLNDLGVEHWKLCEPTVIRGLIYQRLIGVLCMKCRIEYTRALQSGRISEDLANEVMVLVKRSSDQLFVRGDGCEYCSKGLNGRTVVAETVLPDPRMLDCYARNDRTGMRVHWLLPRKEGGAGGIPVMHHAMIRVGMGHCDVNEVEEEIDLVRAYNRDFPEHALRLANEVRILST